jgi:protein-L-isoaspartate(D-aspartate) O-methyltransferase
MGLSEMLESVRAHLMQFGLIDERIISAMMNVDRRNFVSEKDNRYAYSDESLPIGHGQTISQPSTVARMISLLDLKQSDDVLEIGTGSGWSAGLIAEIISPGEVTSHEINGELASRAKKKLLEMGITNVSVNMSDFRLLTEKFNKIIFSAGILPEQEAFIRTFAGSHLKENGILICPFQSGPIIIIKKIRGKIEKSYTPESYLFVPLIM